MAMTEPTAQNLTAADYYSSDANWRYMSNSQYKDFLTCEAAAMAKLRGEYVEEPSDAMLAGSYVHAGIEGTLKQFKAEHLEMFRKDGQLYATYAQAQVMLDVLQSDRMARFVLQGDHEVVVVARFAGAEWKGKLDVINRDEGRFVDVKTVRTIRDKHWDKRYGWVSFVEAYGYVRQMALYAELERLDAGRRDWLEPLILAVSKEDPPDKELISIDPERLQMELKEVKDNIPRVLLVKSGKEEPHRCERCRYCRATKCLDHVTHYMDLIDA